MPISLSDKQLYSVFNSNSFLNVWHGPVRTGKSFACLYRFLVELKDGPHGDYLVTGKSENTIIKNIINPLNDMVDGIIRYKRGVGTFSLFDKKIFAVGANDERAEGKIRGNTYAGCLIDEGTLLPENFFRMLTTRLTVPNSKIFLSTNPDSPSHWLKTGFIDNEDYTNKSLFAFNFEDNPSLSDEVLRNIKLAYTGLWYKRFIMGEWVQAEGAVYDLFDPTLYVKPYAPTYAKQYIVGIDYGTTNSFAAVLIGYNGDHHPALWIEKEYYWDSKKNGFQKTNVEYLNDIKREFGQYPVSMYYIDPSAASFSLELRRAGLPVSQANNDVLEGIRYVSNLFSCGDLIICSSCTNLIKEIQGYVWEEKSFRLGKDTVKKTADHSPDAMRYGLYSHFGQMASLKQESVDSKYLNYHQQQFNKNPMNYPGLGGDPWGWQNMNHRF